MHFLLVIAFKEHKPEEREVTNNCKSEMQVKNRLNQFDDY